MILWHFPPLFSVCRFGFCPDEASWEANRKHVRRTAQIELKEYPTTAGMFNYWRDHLNRPQGLITIHSRYDTDPVGIIGVLTHECVHLVEMIFDAAAEKEPGEETRAYLTEHCVRTIWLDYVKTRGVPK